MATLAAWRGTGKARVDTRSGELEKQVLSRVFGKHGIAIEQYPAGVLVEYRDGLYIVAKILDRGYFALGKAQLAFTRQEGH